MDFDADAPDVWRIGCGSGFQHTEDIQVERNACT